MKVLILGFTKIMYMPYLHFYLDEIDTHIHEVHLAYWARDQKNDSPLPENVIGHCYSSPMEDAIPLRKKLPKIFGYGQFAKKTIRKVNPDFIIVLHSTTAFTVKNLLVKKYHKKYFFDYRDLTYENQFGFYGKAIREITEHSSATFTSSDGFRNVLPQISTIYTSHNIIPNAEEVHSSFSAKEKREVHPIRVAFWGLLRHREINEQIIQKLCGDQRFEVHYYGRAQGKMLELMEESAQQYSNFRFHGEYQPADRLEFANDTDIILNLYDKRGTMLYAMGNKYYDGVVFNIPQLCTEGTYMGNRCNAAQVGFACDPYLQDFAEAVYHYYSSLDYDEFKKACDAELDEIMKQVNLDKSIIRRQFRHG